MSHFGPPTYFDQHIFVEWAQGHFGHKTGTLGSKQALGHNGTLSTSATVGTSVPEVPSVPVVSSVPTVHEVPSVADGARSAQCAQCGRR